VKNPASLHLVYSNSYKNGNSNPRAKPENIRPCIGACQPYSYNSQVESSEYRHAQQAHLSASENARAQTHVYPEQRYNAEQVGAESTTADYATKVKLAGPGFSAEASNEQRPNEFSFRKGNFGLSYNSAASQAPSKEKSRAPITQEYNLEPTEGPNRHPVYFREYTSRPVVAGNQYR
jgi:hypothetical protein